MDFATFLFGLRVQQPAEYRRLQRIRRRIYTKVANLRAEILALARADPVRRARPRAPSARSRAGQAWGKVFDCAWLRITGDVPARHRRRDRDARHPRRGTRRTRRTASCSTRVTTAFQQADLPHSGGRVPARAQRRTSRPDASSSTPMSPTTAGSSTKSASRRSSARTSRPATTRSTRSTTTTSRCSCSPGATEDAALEAELRASSRAAYARFRRGDVAGARAALAARSPRHPPTTSCTARSATDTSTWRGCGRCARRGARQRAPTCGR